MKNYNITLDYVKCYKDKCKKENEKVIKNSNILNMKTELAKITDLKKKEALIKQIYSNKDQNNLDICAFNKCKKLNTDLIKVRINTLLDNIKLYDIKLSSDNQEKLNKLKKLSIKTSLTDEEYLSFIISLKIIQEIVNKQLSDIFKPIIENMGKLIKCSEKNCTILYRNVAEDKELREKKVSLHGIKDTNKRNKLIKEIFSSKKQVELDKCIAKKCNKICLNVIHESMKLINQKIKNKNIKIPDNIKFNDVKKLSVDDIPELIIKFNQISHFVGK